MSKVLHRSDSRLFPVKLEYSKRETVKIGEMSPKKC